MRIHAHYTNTAPSNPCATSISGEFEDYTFSVTGLTPCSGTPAPGNTLSSSNPVCSGVAFTLSLSNSLPYSGITYQWQSSPDNVTWTNIAGATSSTYSATQSAATYYRCLVTCTNSSLSAYSTVVNVTMNPVTSCYCVNTNTTNTSYYISNFTATGTTTINNTTGFSASGYGNFTAMTVTQMQTQTVTFSITETGGTMHFGIWVDWNDDGDFSDAGEEVYYNSTYNTTVSGSFTVPLTAAAGSHRMRVVGNESGTVAACTGSAYTECEDYTIIVTALPNCSGTPNAGTATISSASGCASTNFTLTATGLSIANGITYQWQSGTTATGPWTNITGANSATLTTSATANTWYQLVTTCANSGLSNNTNVVSYTVVGDVCTCGAYPSNYASNTADEDVGNVTVGTLNNSSALGAVAGGAGSIAFRYSNYAGIVGAPNLQQLATTNFSLSSLTTGTSYNNGFQIYIDYNQDGDFGDAGEQVYSSAASTSGPHTETGSFVVPLSATVGITRMRVICVETTFPSTSNYSSTAYSYGETEDYCVNITAAPPCSGTPTGGTTTASSTACGHTGAISVTGSTGARINISMVFFSNWGRTLDFNCRCNRSHLYTCCFRPLLPEGNYLHSKWWQCIFIIIAVHHFCSV
ncbi:hypothetical protein SDC9_66479 [bioreactor metagenome]|uniref:GEVED domain-containing protein n=1 Tax=bioreactor metagenome TaxID=1076179 RepID=A0A644XV03_9ZZZZ